jgi:hypothetical protein
MVYVLIAVGILVVLFVAFIVWRWTSVERGARQRDDAIIAELEPIGAPLYAGDSVPPETVAAMAEKWHVRPLLYYILKDVEKLDIFPEHLRSEEAQAEGALVYWMLHPNELQASPEKLEHVEKVVRTLDGQTANFYVMRYKMPAGHWAADDGWMLGLAGPFFANEPPYSGVAGAFSRCDKDGHVRPAEFVDWFIDMVTQKMN